MKPIRFLLSLIRERVFVRHTRLTDESSLLPAKPGFASVDFDVVGKVTANEHLHPLINQAKKRSNQDLYLINIHLKLINHDINNVGNPKRFHWAKSIEKSVKER